MPGMVRMVRDGLSASVGLALLSDSTFRQAGEVQIEEKIRFVVFWKTDWEGFSVFSSFHFQSAENDFFFQPNDFYSHEKKRHICDIFRIYAV